MMVAETVKAYPVSYPPALIKLSPSVSALPPYSSCSASTLLQSPYPASFGPSHRPDANSGDQETHESGSGLSAAGMSVDLNATPLSKKEMFSQRKQREFIPESKKDECYWDRRRRNNEAAKRSREKRRFNDMILEQRVIELTKENHILKAQLSVIKEKYGIQSEGLINVDQVLASMPQAEQILAISKRNKLSSALLSLTGAPSIMSPMSPGPLGASSGGSSNHHNQFLPQMSPTSTSQYSYSSKGERESPGFYESDNMDHDDSGNDNRPPLHAASAHLLQIPQYATHQYQDSSSAKPSYFEPKALNLSSRSEDDHSSVSPCSPSYPSSIHEDMSSIQDVDMSRHSPLSAESGSCLPHKLRHKTHLGEKDAAHSLLALHGIHGIKSEPRDHFHEDDSTSSDERDSAIGISSSSPPSSSSSDFPNASSRTSSFSASGAPFRASHEDLECENANLRSQIEHLASEVANIKCMMFGRRTQTLSETDSDGSR